MHNQTLTSVKDEIAITRAELNHWRDTAEAHPDWRSPHVHIRSLKAYLKWLYTLPLEKQMMFQSFRFNYWEKYNRNKT